MLVITKKNDCYNSNAYDFMSVSQVMDSDLLLYFGDVDNRKDLVLFSGVSDWI